MEYPTLREFVERIMDERDRAYQERFRALEASVDYRFKASEVAVNAALAAQEKATAAAFLASEKAIVKAEDAQRDYNVRSNEFRGQLDDQAKTLMPRPETQSIFKALEERIEFNRLAANKETYDLRTQGDKQIDALKGEIQGVRETQSLGAGEKAAQASSRSLGQWVTALIIGTILGVAELLAHLMK